MFMDDAIEATVRLMEAEHASLSAHSAYNVSGPSLSPAMVAADIQRHIPDFTMEYAPDFRQQIADTWPRSMDDGNFRKDIDWKPVFDLITITDVMISEIRKKIKASLT